MWYGFLGHSGNVAEPSDTALLCLPNWSTMLIRNMLELDKYNAIHFIIYVSSLVAILNIFELIVNIARRANSSPFQYENS